MMTSLFVTVFKVCYVLMTTLRVVMSCFMHGNYFQKLQFCFLLCSFLANGFLPMCIVDNL